MDFGKYLRFPEIFDRDNPLIICPVDDLLLSGPINGLENPRQKILSIIDAKPDALLAYFGTIKKYYKELRGLKTIINISASTIRSNYTKKVLLGSIENAIRVNANAIAVHINLNSSNANEMIRDAAIIIEQCEKFSIPTVGILYPRGENTDGSTNEYEDLKASDPEEYSTIIAHCVQVGVDLGFDLIKTQFTGTEKSFEKVITTAQGTPIVTAGGPLISEKLAIENAKSALNVGAAGISFARNVFGRESPKEFLDKLRAAL